MRCFAFSIAVLLAAGPAQAVAEDQVQSQAQANVQVAPKTAAELRADQLDRLFARLHAMKEGGDAASVEQQIWELWMSSDSATAEVLLQQATKAMTDRANDQSLQILDRLVSAYPDFAEAWNKRATLYFNMGRYDASLADIDKVLDIEPRHFGALSGRAMIYMEEGKFPDALQAYQDALAVNPSMQSAREAVKVIEKYLKPI